MALRLAFPYFERLTKRSSGPGGRRAADLGALGGFEATVDTRFGHERYWTSHIEDLEAGFAGLQLHRERFGETTVAARVVFWDAAGHFAVETLDGDVPVEIIEAMIAETKERVRA